MPICPECGAEIDMLNFCVTATEVGKLFSDEMKVKYTEGEVDVRCPKCEVLLFEDMQDAKDFLAEGA